MLENLGVSGGTVHGFRAVCSDNLTSAENQQERLINVMGILRGHTPNIPIWDEDMVQSARRRAGLDRGTRCH